MFDLHSQSASRYTTKWHQEICENSVRKADSDVHASNKAFDGEMRWNEVGKRHLEDLKKWYSNGRFNVWNLEEHRSFLREFA